VCDAWADCKHCYLGLKEFAGLGWPARERILVAMRDAGVLWLQLTGGEPTIDPLFAKVGTIKVADTHSSVAYRLDEGEGEQINLCCRAAPGNRTLRVQPSGTADTGPLWLVPLGDRAPLSIMCSMVTEPTRLLARRWRTR
jgi:hypothetical protein